MPTRGTVFVGWDHTGHQYSGDTSPPERPEITANHAKGRVNSGRLWRSLRRVNFALISNHHNLPQVEFTLNHPLFAGIDVKSTRGDTKSLANFAVMEQEASALIKVSREPVQVNLFLDSQALKTS